MPLFLVNFKLFFISGLQISIFKRGKGCNPIDPTFHRLLHSDNYLLHLEIYLPTIFPHILLYNQQGCHCTIIIFFLSFFHFILSLVYTHLSKRYLDHLQFLHVIQCQALPVLQTSHDNCDMFVYLNNIIRFILLCFVFLHTYLCYFQVRPGSSQVRLTCYSSFTVAQKTAPMFVCFSKMFIVWMTETANKSE